MKLSEAKSHLRILQNDLDGGVELARQAAVCYVEDRLGRSLRETETIVQSYPQWPCNPVRFDRHPVKAITSVTYYDADNSLQTVSSSDYRLLETTRAASVLEFDSQFSRPSLYGRSDAVLVTYTAGYAVNGAGDIEIPPQAKWAILLRLEHDWGDLMPREQVANERAVESLLSTVEWGGYR